MFYRFFLCTSGSSPDQRTITLKLFLPPSAGGSPQSRPAGRISCIFYNGAKPCQTGERRFPQAEAGRSGFHGGAARHHGSLKVNCCARSSHRIHKEVPSGRANVFSGTLDGPPMLDSPGRGAMPSSGRATQSIAPAGAPVAGGAPRGAPAAAKRVPPYPPYLGPGSWLVLHTYNTYNTYVHTIHTIHTIHATESQRTSLRLTETS